MIQKQTYWNFSPFMPSLDYVPREYRGMVQDLFNTWANVTDRNRVLTNYYNMQNQLKDLGISIPENLIKVNCVVGWCKKAVDAHAVRSVFDGFVFEGSQDKALDALVRENRMKSLVNQLGRSMRIHGVAFATVMRGAHGQPASKLRVYSASQACGLWDKDEGCLSCGIVLLDVDQRGNPLRYVIYMSDAVLMLEKVDLGYKDEWVCTIEPNPIGRPLMVAFPHDPDLDRPMGHSLLTPEILGITDKAMRDVLRMEVGAEFFTFPQRYILGAADDLFSHIPADEDENEVSADEESAPIPDPVAKFRAYIGAILAISRDENGDIPQVGEFSPSSADNFTRVFENDAQRFSGATNVPLAQLGVLSNTYTSSDALGAANDPLILAVEDQNSKTGELLEEVARMMMAVAENTTLDKLSDKQKTVQAVWKDPSMPTIAARADAWTKLAAADPSIVGTRVYYEGIGLPQAKIDRLMKEKEQNAAIATLNKVAQKMGA